MKSKTLLVLVCLVALLAVLAAVVLRSGKDDEKQTRLGQKVFADLPFQKVEKIRIVSRNGSVTIEKTPAGWVIDQKEGYPADFSKISELVEKLRNLKVGRRFAATAEVTDRLGLHPPSQAGVDKDKSARRLELLDAEGRPVADLLIGKPRQSESGFGGHYLMRNGQSTVLLVDKSFKYLSSQPDKWLHRQVVDLGDDTVESVSFYRDGKAAPVYELKRPAKGDKFALSGAPQASLESTKVNRVVGAMSPLQTEDVVSVKKAGDASSFKGADRFVYSTFSGDRYEIELGNTVTRGDDTFTYARLTKTPADGKKAVAGDKGDEFAGWIYELSKWKTGDFIRKRDELLASEKK